MEISSFQRKSEIILDEYLSWEPSYATHLGWHKYDDRLPDWSERSFEHQLERMSEIVSDLKRIDDDSLTDDEQIDRDFAVHLLKLRIFEMGELRLFEKASLAAKEIGDSLFFLFTRDTPSLEQRLTSMSARLAAAPEFMETSRKLVKTPFKLWNQIEYESGQRLPDLLREIKSIGELKSKDKETVRTLTDAVKVATDAVEEHNKWMKDDVIPSASPDYAIGPSLYGKYLMLKGFGVNAEETLRMAELYLEDVNRKKAEISRTMVPSGDPHDAICKMRCDHPITSREVLEEYRCSVEDAKEFVKKNHLATFPPGEKLHVIETPYFMRHMTAYAAQFEAGVFDKDSNGLFLVTAEDDNSDQLEEHGRATIVNTAVHEGYPGHHLHGVCANLNPSFLRTLYQSPDISEGWALYCEDMMISRGYNDTPTGRLTILNDLAFRIARQICDVKLSAKSMTVEQAAKFISSQTETNLKSATSEANAIIVTPTYFSSYFVGKMGVQQLRDDIQRLLGGKFDLGFFHDALIYSGCMPMSFMRRAVALRVKEKFGPELGDPRESLFRYSVGLLTNKAA